MKMGKQLYLHLPAGNSDAQREWVASRGNWGTMNSIMSHCWGTQMVWSPNAQPKSDLPRHGSCIHGRREARDSCSTALLLWVCWMWVLWVRKNTYCQISKNNNNKKRSDCQKIKYKYLLNIINKTFDVRTKGSSAAVQQRVSSWVWLRQPHPSSHPAAALSCQGLGHCTSPATSKLYWSHI